MYSVQTEICGLLLICLISFLFSRQNALRIVTEKIYTYILYSVFVSVILDGFSILVIKNEWFPIEIRYLICRG
nr:hypothetical protein [Lachnospiraceae bacterium]